MEYIDICKYIFAEERVDWELHNFKSRRRQLVQARQISMYLGNWFYPNITDKLLAGIFGLDHASAQASFKAVKKLLFSDKAYRANMDKYLMQIRERIKKEEAERNEKLLQDEMFRKKLLDTIESMELIAKVYCDIKNKKLTDL